MSVEETLHQKGYVLPEAMKVPAGVVLPFKSVKLVDGLAYVSGHIAQAPDGSLQGPFGRVGREVSLEEGVLSAQAVGLSMLASLKRELGDLERIETWVSAFGMVNTDPGFNQFPSVINGFSNLILEVFGPERGSHTRSAIGMASLPFDAPVEIEAVVKVKSS